MAKKKKPQQQQQTLSPAKYIRLKARTLPIAACYINNSWQEDGMANIIVARQHQSGNFTAAVYLVDIFCLGVKDAFYLFNIPPEELDSITESLPGCMEIPYNQVHNIIYGAIAFAEEEAGIAPHPGFELAQYLLEEDADEIPLIEYEYGKDGKPFLAVQTRLEASKYLPRLRQRYGEDFVYQIKEEEEKFDEYEDWDDEDMSDEDWDDEDADLTDNFDPAFVKDMLEGIEKMKGDCEIVATMPHTTYTYIHPQYPTTLELTHHELEAVYNKEYIYTLPREVIQQLLGLPRESLIADLEHIILYELGKSCNEITDEMYDLNSNTVTHALFLLGELKATESLPTVLEILRQQDSCIDYHFGDSRVECLRPTIYYIARNQIDVLLAFMKEPGLDCFVRSYIPSVIATIAFNEPERREETIDWFRKLLHFLTINVADNSLYDATLAGMTLFDLINIHAKELLPEIKELFDTKQVDFMCCGNYAEVKKEIEDNLTSLSDYSLPDIYERYQQYNEQWNH